MHRGASWASGAAQAAQFVRIIVRWFGFCVKRAASRFFFGFGTLSFSHNCINKGYPS